MDVVKLEKTSIKNRFCRPLLKFSMLLFLAGILVACGGSGGGGSSNAKPVFTSGATPSVPEMTTDVTTVTATDADAADTVTFSITGATADDALFSITAGGVLTFLVAPDFEAPGDIGTDNVYNIEVTANDGRGGLTTQNIAVTVTDVSGAPVFTSGAAPSVVENTTAVTTVTASDDDGDIPTFSITGGTADDALFSIDTNSGVLTFLVAPDFEAPGDIGADNVYDIEVTADDGNAGTTPQNIAVTVTNTNEAPVITSGAAPSVVENTTAVTTVTATDIDGDTPTFSITGGTADDALFSITAGGVLTFIVAPDFEAPGDIGGDNVYNIEVTAADGNGGTTPQNIVVTVTDANDAPVFTSGAAPSVAENTTAVTTATATDVDGDTPTFSITGGTADDALFSIDANSGALTFLAAPNFEAPGDIGSDNEYNIEVTADDGNGGLTTQNIAVTVTDVGEGAVATDDSVTMNEKRTITIDLVGNDTDEDGGDAIDPTTIAIIGGGPTNDSAFVVNADGTVDYTHNGTDTTSDTFDYTVMSSDGSTSNTATVNITVLQGFNVAMYATPSVSASTAAVREAEASDGLTGDASNRWEVAGTTDGEWIQLDFDSTKSIYRVFVADQVDLTNQVTSATISFSDGSSILVTDPLPDNGTWIEDVNDFVFPPKQVDWIRVTLHTAKSGSTHFGLSEFAAYTALEPGQTTEVTDRWNDDDAVGWTVVDDCLTAGSVSSWNVVNKRYVQTGNCRGFNGDGFEHGTHRILDGFNIKDMDLRLRLKSDYDGDVNGWDNGAIGVVFAYRSLNDYYRLDISQIEGHTKLWKMVGGTITELASSPQSLAPDELVNIRIVRQNGVIIVYKDDVKVMAVEDNTTALNNGDYQIGLLCARNQHCQFDTLVVLSSPVDPFSGVPANPIVGANIDDDGAGEHTSGEYFVDTTGSIDVNAVVTDDSAITEVEFVVDEGTGSEVSVIDADGYPYTANFNSLTSGNHTVDVYLRDSSGRLSGDNATEELPMVGVSGIHLVGLGDSITGGLRDDDPSDDTSADGRNTSGGYQPVLNDLLTADNSGMPVTILNEGNPGELSSEGATRMAAVLERTPEAQGYLAVYGANDSSSSVPSGTGLSCVDISIFDTCDGGYIGSFKHNMQKIINAVTAQGKVTYLAKAPPHLVGGVGGGARDLIIQEYNTVIQELIDEPFNGYSGYTPPDFHSYFTANPGEMFDTLHPDGTGYSAMADLWCTALNGQAGIVCAP